MIFVRTGSRFYASTLPSHRPDVRRAAQDAGVMARPSPRVITLAHHAVVAMTEAVSDTHAKRTQV